MQCAFGVEQLKKLPGFVEKRKQNFKTLYKFLKDYQEFFVVPRWLPYSEPSWFCLPLTVREEAPFNRNDIIHYLEDRNIETRLIFAGNITRHPAYKNSNIIISNSLDNADMIMERAFFMGVWPGLQEEQINYVIETFKEFLKERVK
jgi:CDP-6-deoxy-D-xylo-4-hexulose-3-dehydrase